MSERAVSRADLLTMIEDFLTRRLTVNRPELSQYGLNAHATIIAKLQNQKEYLGYDFAFVSKSVKNLGNAKAIKNLDQTAQLILATAKKYKKGKDDIETIDPEELDKELTGDEDT